MTDYLYYKENYQGKIINDKADFEQYAKLAVLYIKSVINSDIDFRKEDIYDCICALAEQLFENRDSKNVKSESVDGYSITYSGDSGKNLYETLKLYLPKELLFRGI